MLLVLLFLLYMASGDESQQVTGAESKHLYLLSTSTALFCYFVLCFETRSDAIALAALIQSVILMPHLPVCWRYKCEPALCPGEKPLF